MRDGDDRAGEPVEGCLQRLAGVRVKVVCRFVEQQQVGALQFQDQDFQAGLLAAGEHLELSPGGVGQAVARERGHRRLQFAAALRDDLQHAAPGEVGP